VALPCRGCLWMFLCAYVCGAVVYVCVFGGCVFSSVYVVCVFVLSRLIDGVVCIVLGIVLPGCCCVFCWVM